ncbi:MAG: PorP/SprF family type IX secretion system membrane protein [Bacteroidia bacterium]
MKKNIFFLLAIAGSSVIAQQLPLLNQYMFNPMLINPAMTYQAEMPEAFGLHRAQWSGIPDGPTTQVFSFITPLTAKKNGFGFLVSNDKTGLYGQTSAYANYSHAVKLNDDAYFSGGISIGAFQRRFDFNRVVVKTENDPQLYNQPINRASFDGAFGLNFNWKGLNVGLSGWQLFESRVRYIDPYNKSVKYIPTRHFSFNAQYAIKVSEGNFPVVITPSAYLRYMAGVGNLTASAPFQADFNVVAECDKYGWVFVGYKSGYAVTSGIGIIIAKKLRAGFSYDVLYLNPSKPHLGTMAEIFVSMKFKGSSKNTGSQALY